MLLLAAALRLFRKVVGLKDDFYNRYLIKGDLFKPLIESFLRNGTKYNLLNSAMIELFEFMRSVSDGLLSLSRIKLFECMSISMPSHRFLTISKSLSFVQCCRMRHIAVDLFAGRHQVVDQVRDREALSCI